MKVKLFSLVLVFACFSLINVNAQSDPSFNQKNEKGQKTGKWKGYHKNGKLRYVGQFSNDTPVDTFFHYFPSGELQTVLIYRNPKEAYAIHYYQTGELLAQGKYLNREKDSIWTSYRAKNIKVEKGNYLKGQKHGKWETFYENGMVSKEVNYENDKPEGSFKAYFQNGKVKQEGIYENGLLNGLSTLYDSQGKKILKGIYKNGIRDKRWIYYDDKQRVEKVLIYENGKLMNPELLDNIMEDLEKYKNNRKDVLEFEDLRGRISYE